MALAENQVASEIFARKGVTTQTKEFNLSVNNATAIYNAFNNYGVPLLVGQDEFAVIDAILKQDSTTYNTKAKALIYAEAKLAAILALDPVAYPGASALATLFGLDLTSYAGAAALAAILALDPFSGAYETATNALFDRQFLSARAMATSGPTNIRGGTPQLALELSDLSTQQSITKFKEVWANQLAVADLVTKAQAQAVASEAARRNDIMHAQDLAVRSETSRRDHHMKAQELGATTMHGLMQQVLVAAEQIARDRDVSIRANAAGAEFTGIPKFTTSEDTSGQGSQAPVTTSFGTTVWR